MKELIKVTTNQAQEPIISGRELHEFLDVKTAYDVWIKRMIEYGFVENLDFSSFLMESTGGRPSTDHHLKLDMAKEIAMVQRNKKGKEARKYFIEVEKEYNSPEKVMARALHIANNEINRLTFLTKAQDQKLMEYKPKVDYVDQILKNPSLVTISQIAKDYGLSGKGLNKILHELKVQYNLSGQWLLYSKYQDKGYVHSETIDIPKSDGTTFVKMNTKWTQKGRLFLYELLKEEGYTPIIEQH